MLCRYRENTETHRQTAHISMRDPMFSAGLLGSAIIDNPPRSAVTLQHTSSSVRLTCGIIGDLDNDSLQWRSYANSTFGKTIYNSTTGLLSDPFKYAIDDDYSLTIKSLTIADGGQYTCILVRDCKENSADVIVISKYYI